MFSVNIFLQVTFIIAHVSASIFQDCGSAYRLTNVTIQGCHNTVPCFVTVGEKILVTMEFIAGFESNHLNHEVTININFINLRPKVLREKVSLSAVYPEGLNEVVTLSTCMLVPSMALNQRGWLEWRVVNEHLRRVVCFRVLVQTQSPRQAQMREQAGPDALTPLPILMPEPPLLFN